MDCRVGMELQLLSILHTLSGPYTLKLHPIYWVADCWSAYPNMYIIDANSESSCMITTNRMNKANMAGSRDKL